MEDFNIKKFLIENKLTLYSKTLKESQGTDVVVNPSYWAKSYITFLEQDSGDNSEEIGFIESNLTQSLPSTEFLKKFGEYWNEFGEQGGDFEEVYAILEDLIERKELSREDAIKVTKQYWGVKGFGGEEDEDYEDWDSYFI